MTVPKIGKAKDGGVMHFSAGALIERDSKFLLIDRQHQPLGFAGPAGHIDEKELPEEAIVREVFEETGLQVIKKELVCEEEVMQTECCTKGVYAHYWYVFKCEVSGEINKSEREVKSIGWYDLEELKKLKLESIWKYWFKKLKII